MSFDQHRTESAWNLIIYIAYPNYQVHLKYSQLQVTNVAIRPLQSIIPGCSSSLIKIIQNGMNNKYLMASFLQHLENQFCKAPGC